MRERAVFDVLAQLPPGLSVEVELTVAQDGTARVVATEFGDQVEVGMDSLATALLADQRSRARSRDDDEAEVRALANELLAHAGRPPLITRKATGTIDIAGHARRRWWPW